MSSCSVPKSPRPAAAPVLLATLAALLTAMPAPAAPPPVVDDSFPTAELLPKAETGVARFLAEHPTYDGRGIVIAIFDTGVDPGAPGLAVTSDGKPKIVDMVDGSGSGDVDTKTVRKAEKGHVEGLTGRSLDVSSLPCPSGEFHVGVKPAFEIFPNALVTRMKEERARKFDEVQGATLTAARNALAAFDAAHPEPTDDDTRTREELAARVDILRDLAENEKDPGPVYDCVVFHDGETWRGVIDTDEDGDLADEKAMANYRVHREWSTFDDVSLLNYSLNVYEEGNLLSIVADCGAHGTHVAGIVAAHFPDDPDHDGMAPGAQLVVVKIGDTRLGASSTGTGSVRGLAAVLDNGCKLINMSFGGPTPSPNEGRIMGLYKEIVDDHGVTFVCSAGNSGPALSTVGGPGGTTSGILGIGAYLSGSMMTAQYALREKLPDTHYTWSSRGPTFDGDLGVALSAPGGAFSPVPNWGLQPTQLMNGTSMASPSVCGGIACLLSGLKAEGIETTPHDIRRALENTAEMPPGMDPFAVGQGLARFDRAWEPLKKYGPLAPHGVRFEAGIPSLGGGRGVYLREPNEVNHAWDVSVDIESIFSQDEDNRQRVAFERRVTLSSTAPWVTVPAKFIVQNGKRSFKIKVDPRGLPPGAHYAEIRAIDTAEPGRGPLFRVPVTVIRPEALPGSDAPWKKTLTFEPGQIRRFFFAVPEGATWADLTVTTDSTETPRQIVTHMVQVMPGDTFANWNTDVTGWFDEHGRSVRSFDVFPGRTLEVCLAQYWSNLGPGAATFELEFHGLVPSEGRVAVDGGIVARRLWVTSALRPETLKPSATADVLRKTIPPTGSEVTALTGPRDTLPRGRNAWQLVLTYDFELEDDAKITVTPPLPTADESWESWESMLWTLFDENKRRIDDGTSGHAALSLDKGKYTLRFQVRSEDEAALRGLRNMPLDLDRTLDPPVKLKVLDDEDGATMGGHEFGTDNLAAGETAVLWVAPPALKSIPKGAEPGDQLLGTLRFGIEGDKTQPAGDRPDGWPLAVRLTSKRVEDEETEADGAPEAKKTKTPVELEEELLDLEVGHLAKLRKAGRDEDFETLSKRLLKEHPRALPVLVEWMRFLAEKKDTPKATIVKACDEVAQTAAATQLAEVLGERAAPEDEAAKATRAKAEKRRDALVEALRRKVEALRDDPSADAQIAEAYRNIAKWTDPAKGEAAMVQVEFERRRGRPAKALEALDARMKDTLPTKDMVQERLRLFEVLGWDGWAAREKRWLVLRFPDAYPPF